MAKKRNYTLDEVNALRVAYGNPLERRELISSLLIPFFVGAMISTRPIVTMNLKL